MYVSIMACAEKNKSFRTYWNVLVKGFLVFPLDLGNVHEGEVIDCVEGKGHTIVCDKVE